MKLINKITKKNIIIISCFLVLAIIIALSTYQNSEKKVTNIITEDIAKLKNLDENRVLEIVETTNPPENITSYKDLVEEILKTSTYTVESVTKVKDEDKVIAVLIAETPENDDLVADFFDTIIKESINEVFNKQNSDKNKMFDVGFKNMLDKMKSTQLNKTTNKIDIIFEKDENNSWKLLNTNAYYDALLGNLFTKINTYKENNIQDVFLELFFESLNKITPEQAGNLFGGDNQNNDINIILSKLYQNTAFTVLDKQKNETEIVYKVKVDMINVKEFYNYSVEQFIKFFKEENDKKQTPTTAQQTQKLQEIFLQSIEVNKDKKISKEIDLKLDNNLNITNLNEFFGLILNGFISESQIAFKTIAERIKMLYTQ